MKSNRITTTGLAAIAWTLTHQTSVFAGMPAPFRLAENATLRLQTLSFFGMLFLASALAIRAIWNSLRADFPRLPRLSYAKSLGLVGLWGSLFLLVLTMISGARELMTPGAWKQEGATYRLTDLPPPEPSEETRRAKLMRLDAALLYYAGQHNGQFPAGTDDSAIEEGRWRTPHASGLRYRYVPGRSAKDVGKVLAYEPELFGEGRLVLFVNDDIKRLTTAELLPLLEGKGQP